MKIHLPILALFLSALATAPAVAQNVLVPKDDQTDAAATGQTTTPSSPAISSSPSPHSGYGSQNKMPPAVYISPEQQKTLIRAQQQALESLQQVLSVITNQPAANRSVQDENADKQRQAELAAEIQKTQARLTLLQSGPLKIADMSKLYQ